MFVIEAPERANTRGGLLQVLAAMDSPETQVFYQGVTYQADPCGHANPVPAPGTDKVFEELPIVEGTPFHVYRGMDSSLFQHQRNEEDTLRAFAAGESWAVERAVHTLHLGANAVDITPTPGAAVTNARQALGILQQYASDNYSALPLIHANRYGTELIGEDLQVSDNYLLHTKQGVPVVNGGGYDASAGPAAAPAGATWIYATGAMHLWRGKPTIAAPAYALKQNRVISLVEVSWVATVECFTAAVLVGV